MFSVQQALDICTSNLASRAKSKSISYVLYYTNRTDGYDGKMYGATIKDLIAEFRANRGNFKMAFITKKDDVKVLRYFNANVSKKFFSMSRTGKKK